MEESTCQCSRYKRWQVWSPSWEESPEEEMSTHASILAWSIPQTEEPGGLQSMVLQRVRLSWVHMGMRPYLQEQAVKQSLLASVLFSTGPGNCISLNCIEILPTLWDFGSIYSMSQRSKVSPLLCQTSHQERVKLKNTELQISNGWIVSPCEL